MKPGEVGTKFHFLVYLIRLSLQQNNVVFAYGMTLDPQIDALDHRFRLFNSHMDALGNTENFKLTK